MNEVIEALAKLGVRGNFAAKPITEDRIAIYIDGKYFGVWDTNRKTFVD